MYDNVTKRETLPVFLSLRPLHGALLRSGAPGLWSFATVRHALEGSPWLFLHVIMIRFQYQGFTQSDNRWNEPSSTQQVALVDYRWAMENLRPTKDSDVTLKECRFEENPGTVILRVFLR